MKQSEESESSSSSLSPSPSTASSPISPVQPSSILKTVNPFDYIKGRGRLERPADIVSSFKEKLRLDEIFEEEKLKKLFSCKNSKDFENLFFEHFHPVKESKIFLNESFEDQKSSSRLISPVVCSKVLDWSLKKENEDIFVESVILALINSGHVSLYSNSGLIIDKIIELKSSSLLLALLNGFTDLSDSGLTKLILFLIESESESKDIFKNFDSECQEFKFNDQISISETCFLTLLSFPKSFQLIKKYFLLVKETEIISLIQRLIDSLKLFTSEKHFKINSKCSFKAPNSKQIIEWLSLIIDSQYPLCLIQPNLLKSIESVNSFISQENSLNSNLLQILPSIKEIRSAKTNLNSEQKEQKDQIRISVNYSIEPSTI